MALALPMRRGKALGATGARHDAERDFRQAEFGRLGGDDEIAHHGELAAAAEAISRDRRNHWLASLRQTRPAFEELAEIGFDKSLVSHLLHIGTRGKRLVAAGDNSATDMQIILEYRQGGIELLDQRLVEGVEGLRAIERDEANVAPRLDNDILVGHGGSYFWQWRQ